MNRKPVPLGTKYLVLLRQALCAECKQPLGDDVVHYDHRPAIWERPYSVVLGDYDPPSNDPEFLDALHSRCHLLRTHGRPATTLGSDSHRRAKGKRIQQKVSDHLEIMKDKRKKEDRRSRWPKRKFGQ